MKYVLNPNEVAQIVINHLVEEGKFLDDSGLVCVNWNLDGRNSTLTLEEHNE